MSVGAGAAVLSEGEHLSRARTYRARVPIAGRASCPARPAQPIPATGIKMFSAPILSKVAKRRKRTPNTREITFLDLVMPNNHQKAAPKQQHKTRN